MIAKLEILKYAAFGLHMKIEEVKKAPMLNEVREKRLAKLEEKRREICKMAAELEVIK